MSTVPRFHPICTPVPGLAQRPLRARAWFAVACVATIAACDPADVRTDPDEAPRASVAAPPQAAPTPPLPTAASRMEVELRAVRSRGDEVQVEVALDRPLPPMALARPELQVGDEIVRRSRSGADGRVDRLIFTMPAAQFERMPKDRAMIVRAGVLDNSAAQSKPTLSDVAVIGGGQ
ncbi:MAG: hypothetical protein JNK45_02015 [Myxococcales bacterium]|nr:hypothetical protein [Myxococcales bacterium]